MARAACFIVSYSIAVIVLFSVLCFLMTTINPPMLNLEVDTIKTANKSYVFLRDVGPNGDFQYGLEKAYNSLVLPSSTIRPLQLNNRILPDDVTRFYLNVITSPKDFNFIRATTSTNAQKLTKGTSTDDLNETTNDIRDHQIKGHRRSVEAVEKKRDEIKTGSVILKILNDIRKPHIAIKLNSKPKFDKSKFRLHRSTLKTNNKFHMVIEGKVKELDLDELPDQTEIKILPNDTVMVANEIHDLGKKTIDLENTYTTAKNKTFPFINISSKVQSDNTSMTKSFTAT